MDDRALEDLRRLAARDEELAGRAAALRSGEEQVAAIRTRTEAIDAFFAAYPAEETKRRAAHAEAAGEADRRREAVAAAEAELASAREDEERTLAEQALARARDHLSVTEAKLARALADVDELERDAARLPGEVETLEQRAASLEPASHPSGIAELLDWASHRRAELFVATSQLDTARERVIREANELASMLLGEATYGSTPAQVLARVERAWTSSPGHVSESR